MLDPARRPIGFQQRLANERPLTQLTGIRSHVVRDADFVRERSHLVKWLAGFWVAPGEDVPVGDKVVLAAPRDNEASRIAEMLFLAGVAVDFEIEARHAERIDLRD